jgi:hypothetical protein
MRKPTVLQLTAIHEAGHAVAARLYGMTAEYAHIRSVTACRGLCLVVPGPDARTERGRRVILAGDAAVQLLEAGYRAPTAHAGPWYVAHALTPSSQIQAAGSAVADDAGKLAGAVSPEAIAASRAAVSAELARAWPAVTAIADALLELGQLERAEIAAILDRCAVRPIAAAQQCRTPKAAPADPKESADSPRNHPRTVLVRVPAEFAPLREQELARQLRVSRYVVRGLRPILPRLPDGRYPPSALHIAGTYLRGSRGRRGV